jgi:GNAT superfamily N-acetyltransferase
VTGDGDLAAYLEVRNAVAPELAIDRAEARYEQRQDPTLVRLVAELGGAVAGAAGLGRNPYLPTDPNLLLTGIWVARGARGQGVGSALLEAVCSEAHRRGARELEGPSSDADPDGQAFFKKRGFAERDRSRYVALDVRSARLEPALPPPGVTLTSLAEHPDLLEAVYAVACEAIPDVPEEEPMTAGSFEDWRAFWIDPPSVRPERVFLGTVDGHVAGYSTLALPGARPGVGVHTMTGVARAHRGRGIAAALKRHAIAWAAANGVQTLESENVEANAAIRTLNDQLGYRPKADHVWLHGPVDGNALLTEAP